MRVVARAGRFGLLLALLLVLLGVRAPTASHLGDESPASGFGSASTTPTMYDGVQDRVRLFAVARAAQAAPLPDTWWATCPRAIGTSVPSGRLPIGDVGCTGTTSAISTQQSGRAPPRSV
ncbi:hypothetical protein ACFFQW_11795 [Umezawaea endophytica]|uniref:Uncharacterized protein n=1 Tax=Umezawaea endophytica TaxID=1654476 RepID=A0A9X3AI21_9PSEU|nr:hypothetical protein [Umezawaea endophytica]MCS7482477.1 hypothetical protein [Umezawaea endophytica]